ncbi:MAG: hypothetical protein K2G63_00175 [Oscillospiraceae bacterium]|nr:hypothetical protein [Oscillospiraceae bacterium]
MIAETVSTATENSEGMTIAVSTIIKFGAGMVFVMFIIYLLAVLTPKIAKHTDKFIEKHRTEKENYRTDEVRGIYDLPLKKNDDNNNNQKEDVNDG